MENARLKTKDQTAAFVLTSYQRDLSAMYSGAEIIILSCSDVQLICLNDLSSLAVCLNLLICELACIYVCIASCIYICYVQNNRLLTYLLTYLGLYKRQSRAYMRRHVLHWLNASDRIKFRLCVTIHKCIHGIAPGYLSELCRPVFAF